MTGDEIFRAIFEASPLGIALVGPDMRFRRANPALLAMLGYTEAELAQLSPADITHADDVRDDAALFHELLGGQRSAYAVEKRYRRKDGSLRWVRLAVSVHPATSPPLIIGMVEDISARRAAEEEHRELGERVKELTALHRAASVMHDAGLAWTDRLQAVADLLPAAMQFPEVTTACLRYGGQVYATPGHATTPWTLSADVTTSDGQRCVLEVAYREARGDEASGPFLAEEVALLGSLAEMVRAAIDRHEAEAAVRQANERLNLALSTAGMGVWEWDVRANTVRWSEQLSEMTGIDHSFGPFAAHASLVHPADREQLFRRLEDAAEGGDDLRAIEFRFERPGGGWRAMLGSARVIREPPARATRILAALVDVSERRALEESLRQAQKLEALGQVAGGVAHDFNNLLSVLLSGSQALQEEIPCDHPAREIVDDLLSASGRGVALTQQLLTFSRKASFQPAAVDVCAIVTRLQPILKRLAQQAVEVRLRLDPSAGKVWADPTQIEQVLMNLVVNARDAMPDGGVVTVAASAPAEVAADGSAAAPRYALLEVSDTGPGIDPAVQDRIFEPFFTTKATGKGTGLGLAMVSRVAQQWGGHVSLESVVGQGTTFRLRFPRLAD